MRFPPLMPFSSLTAADVARVQLAIDASPELTALPLTFKLPAPQSDSAEPCILAGLPAGVERAPNAPVSVHGFPVYYVHTSLVRLSAPLSVPQ